MHNACYLHRSSIPASENMSSGDTSFSGKLLAKDAKVQACPLAAQRSFYIPMKTPNIEGVIGFSIIQETESCTTRTPASPYVIYHGSAFTRQ